MRILLGIQARSNSVRLPGKIYKTIGDKTILEWVFEAAKFCAEGIKIEGDSAEVFILGPKNDEELKKFCAEKQIPALFPDCEENDLVSRYALASEEFTHVARITADCWCIHPDIISQCVSLVKDGCHYGSNTIFRTFQEGQDMQVFTKQALTWLDANYPTEREHPWSHFDLNDDKRKEFKEAVGDVAQLINRENEATVKTSIDTSEDLELATRNYDKWKTGQKKSKTN